MAEYLLGSPTWIVPTAGKEGLDVVFVKTIDTQHFVEPLKILHMSLKCHLLPPAA